jgi:hypothetical protein
MKRNNDLTVEELKALLRYEPRTGKFYWRRPKEAGKPNPSLGYIQISINSKFFTAHRLAVVYMTGRWPEHVVHHINGNRQDNRWVNLIEATSSENNHLITRRRRDNLSGYAGVYWFAARRKWTARISCKGQRYYLGLFETKEAAAEAYKQAARRLYGDMANA